MMHPQSRWPAAILDHWDEAVAVIDDRNTVVYANRLAREQLLAAFSDPPALLGGEETARLAAEVRQGARPRQNIALEPAVGTAWRGRAVPLEGGAVAFVLRRAADRQGRTEALARAMGLHQGDAELALLTAEGMSNRDIADRYGIPIGTVATRLWRLYRKVGVSNRAELAAAVGTVARGDDGLVRAAGHLARVASS